MANRIPENIIDDIRHQVDIVEIISHYVDLTKRGKNYVGLCPFHEERTPSFTVEPEKQFFKCFSCGRGGNVFSFVMEADGIGFKDAVQKVSELGNVSVNFDFDSVQDQKRYREKDVRLIKIHDEVATFYHYVLTTTKIGEPALDYLRRRGLSDEIIETFNIGLAPSDRELTYRYLRNKSFSEEELKNSGLFLDDQPNVDRFANRIVFPLRNEYGDTIAFSGRVWRDSQQSRAKYLNSPETTIFQKNRFLFNFDQAKKRAKKELTLFEGFMDVISAYGAGVNSGVASLGTSLTDNQIQILAHQTEKVVVAYDGDAPGFKAIQRAIERFHVVAPQQKVAIVLFPEGLDPDEFIQRHGAERFQQFLKDQQLSIIQFYRVYYQQLYTLNDDDEKLQYVRAMLKEIATYTSDLEENIQLNTLSEDTGVSVEVLKSQLAILKKQTPEATTADISFSEDNVEETLTNGSTVTLTYDERAGMQLLNRLIYHPEIWQYIEGSAPALEFETDELETIYLLLSDQLVDEPEAPINTSEFYNELRSEKARQYFTQIISLDLPPEWTTQEIDDLIRQLTVQPDLQRQNEQLAKQIDQARRINDFAEMQVLNRQRIDNLRRLKNNR